MHILRVDLTPLQKSPAMIQKIGWINRVAQRVREFFLSSQNILQITGTLRQGHLFIALA
jgi:hypothetical protein